jgi:hypothetical protein
VDLHGSVPFAGRREEYHREGGPGTLCSRNAWRASGDTEIRKSACGILLDKSGYTKYMYSTESTNNISEDGQVLSLIDELNGEDAGVA